MKNKGFISTSLIYTFFILFLLLMLFLLNTYSHNRILLEKYKSEIKEFLYEQSSNDFNLFFMVWDDESNDYELNDNINIAEYQFNENISYCKNNSTLQYYNGKVSAIVLGKDMCYAYFKKIN